MARTFVLIAPAHPVLHRVSCSNETIPNPPKHYSTHQNMSLGSNGADWVRSLRKIRTWIRGTNFFINCTSSHRFAPSFSSYEMIQNAPKHYATDQNMSLESNGADLLRSLRKIPIWLRGTNFCINCTSSPRFAPSLMQLWNDPKCTQTICYAPKHQFRVQWGGLGAFV